MKPVLYTIAILALLGTAFAAQHPMQKATLVSVVLHDTSSPADNFPNGQPGRVPPGPITYTYQFTLRQGCTEYTGLYDSFRKNFAAGFQPNQEVGFRYTRHLIYLHVPGHDDEEDMSLSLSSRHDIPNCTPVSSPTK